MTSTHTPVASNLMRTLVAVAAIGVCILLIVLVLGVEGSQRFDSLYTFAILAVGLATYASLIFPRVGSVSIGFAFVVCFVWVWAAARMPEMRVALMALVGLLVISSVEQARRMRRLQRLIQVTDDLREERSVKEQAVHLAETAQAALRKKRDRYTQLQTIAESLSNMIDLPDIRQLAVDRAFSLIGKSDVCLLFLVDTTQQELSLFASRRRSGIAAVHSKHGDQFDRYVLRTQRPLFVNDVRRDFRFTVRLSADRTTSAVVAAPLMINQRATGVLRLDSSQPNAYTQDDLRLLDILLGLVSTAVTNGRLFRQTQQLAMTDGLTGLVMRRPFMEQFGRELTRVERSRDSLSVLMVDMDHLKEYNDSFGHTAGDLVLKALAEILRNVVPPDGVSARYGGEEFAVLLPRAKRHQASEVAEMIRQAVEGHTQPSGRSLSRRVTVSIGVATFPEDGTAQLELIRAADERLYQAKRAGRNLVCSS